MIDASIMASKTYVYSEDQLSKALTESLAGFSFKSLKPYLPTGFGKSIIYQLLPKVLAAVGSAATRSGFILALLCKSAKKIVPPVQELFPVNSLFFDALNNGTVL